MQNRPNGWRHQGSHESEWLFQDWRKWIRRSLPDTARVVTQHRIP